MGYLTVICTLSAMASSVYRTCCRRFGMGGGLSRSFCVPHLRSRAATERADSGDTGGCVRDYMQYFINNGLVFRICFCVCSCCAYTHTFCPVPYQLFFQLRR